MATNIFDDYIQKIAPLNQREGRLDCMSNFFLDSFKNAPEYDEVKLYQDDTIDSAYYDAWIYSDNAYKEVVSTRVLLFPPTMAQHIDKVFRGQYVRPNRLGGALYLITARDAQYIEKIKCEITRCTQTLRWYNNNAVLVEVPCVIEDKYTNTGVDNDPRINTNKGDAFVTAPYNINTKEIKINDRFVFNGQPFKVGAINNFINNSAMTPHSPSLIYLDLYYDPIASGDDIINNIPAHNINYTISINTSTIDQSIGYTTQLIATLKRNGDVYTAPLTWESSNPLIATVDNNGNVNLIANGNCMISVKMTDNPSVIANVNVTVQSVPVNVTEIRISPNVTELLQNSSQTYEAFVYINGIKQPLTSLTFTASGTTTDKYSLTIVDGNHFTLKNTKKTTAMASVTITATDGTNSAVQNVKLKGSF